MLNNSTSSDISVEPLVGRDTIQLQLEMLPDHQVIDDALQIRIKARSVYNVDLPPTPSPFPSGLGFG